MERGVLLLTFKQSSQNTRCDSDLEHEANFEVFFAAFALSSEEIVYEVSG